MTMTTSRNFASARMSIKMRCPEFPYCDKEECEYIHPFKPCGKFPNCTIADACTFLHPPCKFQSKCRKMFDGCKFDHDRPYNQYSVHFYKKKCRYYPLCRNKTCKFFHPRKNCKYWGNCPNEKECKFIHLNDQFDAMGLSDKKEPDDYDDHETKISRSLSLPNNAHILESFEDHRPRYKSNYEYDSSDEEYDIEQAIRKQSVFTIPGNLPQAIPENEALPPLKPTPSFWGPPPAYSPTPDPIYTPNGKDPKLPPIGTGRKSSYSQVVIGEIFKKMKR